jgi:hypothetical protein
MKYKLYLIIIYALSLFNGLKTEGQSKNMSTVLMRLYDRILFTSSDEEKLRLNDSIVMIMDGFTASDSVFSYKFSNLRFLGQITSSDSKIKLITWNLMLRDGKNKYFCYLIRKSRNGSINDVKKLMGENREEAIETDRPYSAGDWYGALYYAIEPCRKDYILLGLDFSSMMVSRKIIDVLSFATDGEVVFGKDLFMKENVKQFREVIEYSSESVVTLRFKSPKMIVFDHLESFSTGDDDSESKGAGLFFDGYVYRKGIWTFTTGIDVRNPRK